MAQNNTNPWPMRVAILGLVCLLIGAVAIFSNMDQIDEASSPKINEVAITGGGAETIELRQAVILQWLFQTTYRMLAS